MSSSLGREIKCPALAEMLQAKGSKETKTQYARRWMKSLGVALRHKGSRCYFTTISELKKVATAEHIRLRAIRDGYEE